MQKAPCIGCKTSFQDSQEFGLQSLTTQFKNYQIPFRDDHAKWNILKAILSFLNSKGGTIFIGIEDKKGAVQGLFLQRKDRDTFKLSMKQLIQKIYPKVDLNNKQQVEIQYIPIFKDNIFEGKFVVKIIVQQGDPSQVYCISERIKLQGGQNNKSDQFQVFYAYQRHNMGGAEQIKGVKLMRFIHQRAKNPNKVASIFHENCNPQPPYIELQIRTIIFSNINQQQNQYLQSAYSAEFQKLDIDYQLKYDKQKEKSQIYIEDEEDFETVKDFIQKHLTYLNKLFTDTDYPVNFIIKGQVQNYFSIVNAKHGEKIEKGERQKRQKQSQKHNKKQQSNKETKFPYKQANSQKYEKQGKNTNKPYQNMKIQQKRQISTPKAQIIKQISPKASSQYIITFTHIEPRAIDSLQTYLTKSICREYQKKFTQYVNTIEMSLANQKERLNCLAVLIARENQLSGYGFKNEIRYGVNTNQIKICNLDNQKTDQAKGQLVDMMKRQLVACRLQKNTIICQMIDHQAACSWLDTLLMDRQFKKKYSRKGNHRQGIPKLKFYICVKNTAKE